MPYGSAKALPPNVKKLSAHKQGVWKSAFNAAYSEYKGDEKKAFATAWAAANKISDAFNPNQPRDKDGKWSAEGYAKSKGGKLGQVPGVYKFPEGQGPTVHEIHKELTGRGYRMSTHTHTGYKMAAYTHYEKTPGPYQTSSVEVNHNYPGGGSRAKYMTVRHYVAKDAAARSHDAKDSTMSNRLTMHDTFTLAGGIKRTQDGYLTAVARVARTGIQVYKGAELGRPDLDKVRVYRSPAEVFKDSAMKSFAHRPITYLHPSETVDARNWKKYAVGHTGEDVVRDGEYIRVPMMLMDQAAINTYEHDGVRELSMGYSTELKWEKGHTDDGEPYDAIQTDIRGNHLAVVPVARGGASLRIGDHDEPGEEMDEESMEDARPFFFDREFSTKAREKAAASGAAMPGGGYPIENEQDLKNAIHAFGRAKNPEATKAHIKKRARALGLTKLIPENWDAAGTRDAGSSGTNKGVRPMRSITLDSVPIELDDQSAAIVLAHIDRLNRQVADAQGMQSKAEADKEEAEEKKTRAEDEMKKACDARDAEIATLKKQLSDAQDPAKYNAAIKDLLAVAGKAKSLMGDAFVTDGKSPEAIRREVVDAKMGEAAKGWTDDAVAVSFNTLSAHVKSADAAPPKKGQPNTANFNDANGDLKAAIAEANQRRGVADGSMDAAIAARDAAFNELQERSRNAWRTTNGKGIRA